MASGAKTDQRVVAAGEVKIQRSIFHRASEGPKVNTVEDLCHAELLHFITGNTPEGGFEPKRPHKGGWDADGAPTVCGSHQRGNAPCDYCSRPATGATRGLGKVPRVAGWAKEEVVAERLRSKDRRVGLSN